ncbi:hypothetical protein [Sphingosinicella rhizophila]|uniref:Uncharacterized protein n=1 Tax=Sphingosinicella rhizophila TaxID=3050082 RepID=A0ABU3Q745_9SPHN|nr:hypothetical protein [Sphingosinicella sp. GR2756]MDT9599227.1 hypothetical protein [Sphingosinicella sp. GR2756]
MVRLIIGSAAAAVAMFVLGFLLYATPLSRLGYASLSNEQAAAVQQAMAANLPRTGTYAVPGMDTAEQTNMYSRGPIATVHYNTDGFAATDPAMLAGGLVFYFVVALIIGLALIGIDRRVPDFPSRAKLVIAFAVAASALLHLSEPIFYRHDWGHFIYLFIADAILLAAGGLVIARWFLAKADAAMPGAPTDV